MTNEQKCPVCGTGVFGEVEELYHCPDCGWIIHKETMHKIQSRIDKEKSAAVQEERERVVREVLAVAKSVSMPYENYLVIKDVLNNIRDEIG